MGRKGRLLSDDVCALVPADLSARWTAMVESLVPGDTGAVTSSWFGDTTQRRAIAVAIPDRASRHVSPVRADAWASLLHKQTPRKGDVTVILAMDRAEDSVAVARAAGRGWPEYTRKSSAGARADRTITLVPVVEDGKVDLDDMAVVADSVRLAARLVDAPTCDLDTDRFVEEAQAVAEELGCACKVIRGEELVEHGLGGIWGVGKAAQRPPALVVLTHKPKRAKKRSQEDRLGRQGHRLWTPAGSASSPARAWSG